MWASIRGSEPFGVGIGVGANAKVGVSVGPRVEAGGLAQLMSAAATAMKEKNISPVLDRAMGLYTLVPIG
ncbi:MAG TPA: hypothetical protein VMV04_09910 [Thermodesulfobacteriota bacterium]|nr:hypothetical protein [Thermodesulfobacteriota bacterium]